MNQSAMDRLYDNTLYGSPPNIGLLQMVREDDVRILDVGCGKGGNCSWLREKGKKVYGVTLSDLEAAHISNLVERVDVANIETWEIPYEKGFFDGILLSHVLEHLVDPWETLRKLSLFLRDGGRVYVGVPNIAHLPLRWQIMNGRFEYQEMGPMDQRHLRFFNFRSAQELLRKTGFTVVYAEAGGHFPLGPLRKVLPKICSRLDQKVVRTFPNLFGYEIWLTGEKQKSMR